MSENKKDDIKKDEGGVMDTASSWWGGIVGEFKRIAWSNRQTLVKMTIASIIVSGIVGAIIVGYDLALSYGYDGLRSITDFMR